MTEPINLKARSRDESTRTVNFPGTGEAEPAIKAGLTIAAGIEVRVQRDVTRLFTGSLIPEGANTVVMQEYANERDGVGSPKSDHQSFDSNGPMLAALVRGMGAS